MKLKAWLKMEDRTNGAKTGGKFTFFELLGVVFYRSFLQIKSLFHRGRKESGKELDERKL